MEKTNEEMRLYKEAVESIKRYKEQGEELTDFDDFFNEEERIFKAYSRMLLRDLQGVKEALKAEEYTEAEKIIDNLIEDTQKGIEGQG